MLPAACHRLSDRRRTRGPVSSVGNRQTSRSRRGDKRHAERDRGFESPSIGCVIPPSTLATRHHDRRQSASRCKCQELRRRTRVCRNIIMDRLSDKALQHCEISDKVRDVPHLKATRLIPIVHKSGANVGTSLKKQLYRRGCGGRRGKNMRNAFL